MAAHPPIRQAPRTIRVSSENHPFLVLDGGRLSKEAGLVMIKSTYEQQRKRFGLSEVSDIFAEPKTSNNANLKLGEVFYC